MTLQGSIPIRWLLWDRQWGKTTTALEWVKEDLDHRVLLCAEFRRAERIRNQHGLTEKNVCDLGRWLQPGWNRKDSTVAVDDLDSVLYLLLAGATVGLVTATGRPEAPPDALIFDERMHVAEIAERAYRQRETAV